MEREYFGFYRTWWQEAEALYAKGDYQILSELIIGLCRYAFEDSDWEPQTNEAKLLLIGKKFSLDQQLARYMKSQEVGRTSYKISDEDFLQTILNGNFVTQAQLARELGVTPQAVSKRLQKFGVKLNEREKIAELLAANPERDNSP